MSKPLGFNVELPLSFDAAVTRVRDALKREGLLLPCNVAVEWISDRRTGVGLTDPEALLSTVALDGTPQLASVAHDARQRMLWVADSLSKP